MYRLSFLPMSKWGYFLPDLYRISVGIRQVVLDSKLFKADRKIRPGQQPFSQTVCLSAGWTLSVFLLTLQRQTNSIRITLRWTCWLWAPGDQGDRDRPTHLPGMFRRGTDLRPSTCDDHRATVEMDKVPGCIWWQAWVARLFHSTQQEHLKSLVGCHTVHKRPICPGGLKKPPSHAKTTMIIGDSLSLSSSSLITQSWEK